jgi:hypothetical protein
MLLCKNKFCYISSITFKSLHHRQIRHNDFWTLKETNSMIFQQPNSSERNGVFKFLVVRIAPIPRRRFLVEEGQICSNQTQARLSIFNSYDVLLALWRHENTVSVLRCLKLDLQRIYICVYAVRVLRHFRVGQCVRATSS